MWSHQHLVKYSEANQRVTLRMRSGNTHTGDIRAVHEDYVLLDSAAGGHSYVELATIEALHVAS